MVERSQLDKIMDELAIQMTGAISEDSVVKIGNGIGAKLLITGELYPKTNSYELFLKLLRVETDEVLSVTKLKIDKELGL